MHTYIHIGEQTESSGGYTGPPRADVPSILLYIIIYMYIHTYIYKPPKRPLEDVGGPIWIFSIHHWFTNRDTSKQREREKCFI